MLHELKMIVMIPGYKRATANAPDSLKVSPGLFLSIGVAGFVGPC